MTALLLLAALASPPAPKAPAPLGVQDGTIELARALIAKDLEKLVSLTPAPFSFDGSVARTPLEVRERWAAILDRHPVDRLHLYGVELLPYDQAVARYGKPPARLGELPWRGSMIAIANLGGRATIVVWKRRGDGFVPIAITD